MKAPLAKGRLFAILAATSAAVAACSGGGAAPAGSASASQSATPSVATTAPSEAVATAAPANATPTAGPTFAGMSSDVCDPWLTADAVASVVGKAPQSFSENVNPSVNEWPGPIACQWVFGDGSFIRFTAGYSTEDRNTAGALISLGGKSISGLGDAAAFGKFGALDEVHWVQGTKPFTIMTLGSHQLLDEAQLTSLARAVTVPSL